VTKIPYMIAPPLGFQGFYVHRTMAEVAETEDLARKQIAAFYAGKRLPHKEARRLNDLSRQARAANHVIIDLPPGYHWVMDPP